MAKKINEKGKVDPDLNFDDLSDLGDDEINFDEDFDSGGARDPSRSKVAKELLKETGAGFFDSLVKKATKDALPEQYESSYYDAMDIASFAGDVVDKNKQKLNKTAFKLGREVKKILPFKLSMLDKYLEAQASNFEAYKQQSEEEIRNAGIQSELSSIFDKQIEVQKSMEARREAQDEVDRRDELVKAKMSQDLLSNIDANVARQSAFTLEISKHFYRKSLEIQFKSYFVQADMLRTMRDSYKAFAIQFTNIEKNTSLPEFVKLKSTERLHEILRTQATQSMYTQLFDKSKYMEGAKKRLSGFVDGKIDDITNSVDMFTDMLGNLTGAAESTGQSPISMMTGVASSFLGGTLGEKIASKIPKGVKDKIKNNKYVNAGANYLNLLSNSPSTLLQSLRAKAKKTEENTEDEGTPGRWLASKASKGLGALLDVATPGAPTAEVKQLGYLDHKQPAIFDNNVHRSISETIPLYLAKILQQNTDLTRMYHTVNVKKLGNFTNASLLSYDFANRKLSTDGEISKEIEASVFKEKSGQSKSKSMAGSILADSLAGVDKSSMSKADKKNTAAALKSKSSNVILSKYVDQAKLDESIELTYENLITNYKANPTLNELVSKDPKLELLLATLQKTKPVNETFIDSKMKDMRRVYPLEGVRQLFNGSSKLAGSKTPHIPKDSVLEIFAKCFSAYMLATGKDVDVTSVINSSAFLYIEEKDLIPDIKKSIAILQSDVRRVYNADEIVSTTSLDVLFGIMAVSLKENINDLSEVFQTLADLNPNLVGKGKLQIENMAEGKIGIMADKQYVGLSDIKGLSKITNSELNKQRGEVAGVALIDKIAGAASARLKTVQKAMKATNGNPVAMAELLVKSVKTFKTSVTGKLQTNLQSLQTGLTEALNGVSNITEKNALAGISKTISVLQQKTVDIDSRIALLNVNLQERLTEISNTTSELELVSSSKEVSNRMKSLDKAYVSYTNSEIKSLKKLKETLENQITFLTDCADKMSRKELTLASFFKDQYGRLMTSLETLKKELHELEELGKEFELSLNSTAA